MSSLFDIIIQRPLPEPWIKGLLFTSFTLHMLFVLLALGTAILALYYFIDAWWGGRLKEIRWDKEILRTFLAHKSLAVVLGVAALLTIQVSFTLPFFTAISFHAKYWMLIVVFLIVAFLFLDFLGQRIYTHHYLHLVFGVIGVIALLAVPGIFVAVLVTAENLDKWESIAQNGYKLTGPLALHWLIRYLHVIGASLVFAGSFHYLFSKEEDKKRSLFQWIVGGMIAQFILGIALYESIPTRPGEMTKISLLVGILAAAFFLWTLFRHTTTGVPFRYIKAVPLLMLILVPMLLARQFIQDRELLAFQAKAAENARIYEKEVRPYRPDALAEYKQNMSIVFNNGKTIYLRSCAFCHGENADGNGPEAKDLSMPPANLAATRSSRGFFRKILVTGIPGTPMPYFSYLDISKIDRLIDYLDTKYNVLSTQDQK